MSQRNKSALMESPVDIRIATTAGYAFDFKAGVPKFVPAVAVAECRKFGIKELKRYRNTDMTTPGLTTKGRVVSQVQASRPIDQAVMEEDLDVTAPEPPEPKRNDPVFSEAHTKIRNAILEMVDNPDSEEFTNGRPKVNALAKRIPDMSPNANMRDEVWDKMEKIGEIPDDLEERLG